MPEYAKDPVFFSRMEYKRFPLPDLPADELMRYVWDVEEVRDVMSIRAWLSASDLRGRELDTLWVSDPEYAATASYGADWGYYVGMDAIRAWYLNRHTEHRQAQKCAYEAAHPGTEATAGHGCCSMFPTTTPVIRVAGDGKTARGLWYIIGQRTDLKPDGCTADARWCCGRLAAEFVREADGWKIWHLLDLNDMNYEAGTDYNGTPTYIPEETDVMELEFGKPTIPITVHNSAFNWAETYPRTPEPYDTYDLKTGYGPEGHPAYLRLKKEGSV